MALMDTQKAVWDAKRFYDSGRPASLVKCLVPGTVQSWNGPYKGTQSISASEWTPYIPTSPLPGYVSATAALSAASAAVAELYLGAPFGGSPVTVPAGGSRIEPKLSVGQAGYVPGVTDTPNRGSSTVGYSPASPVTLTWDTWQSASENAITSQLYAGVHIEADLVDGRTLGKAVAASVIDYSSQLFTGGPTAVHYLSNKDFEKGTLIISKPGIYRLTEDIVFNPNPPTNTRDAYDSFVPLPGQFVSNGGIYSDQNYALGFFAAISIVTSDVTIDLNGHTLKQSADHALMQRFFALIELNNQPFLAGQGPHDFGTVVAATNVEIKSGTLGLSSHHGIHGNGNADVRIRDVEFVDFEIAAVSLNGVEGLLIERCSATNRKDVPVLGTFSNARFIRPYVDFLVASSSPTTIRVGGKQFTPLQIQSALRESVNNVYADVMTYGTIQRDAHPKEYRLFHNPSQLVDGNCYAILIGPLGQAVNEFPPKPPLSARPSQNVIIRSVVVNSIHATINEVVALNRNGAAVTDPVGATFQLRNVDPDGLSITISSLTDSSAAFVGNVLANSQALVAKAALRGEFPVRLNTRRNLIDATVLKWIEATPGTTPAKISDAIAKTESSWFCNGDTMFHVMKGVIPLRLDGTFSAELSDISIRDIFNYGRPGSTACGAYYTSQPLQVSSRLTFQILPGYRGADTRGIALSGSNFVTVNNVAIDTVRSTNGNVYAIDVIRDSSDMDFGHLQLSRIRAPLATIGVRLSADSSNIKLATSCITEAEIPVQNLGSNNVFTPHTCGNTAKLIDITAEAGLPDRYKEIGDEFNPMIGGAAIGDFDSDGWPDVFLPRMTLPNLLLRNNRNKTFVDVTAGSGLINQPSASAGFVDIDNDGDLDLFVVGHAAPNRLFLNTGGSFTDVTTDRGIFTPSAPTGFSVGFGDYDLDGCVDIIATQWTNNPQNKDQNTRIYHNKCGANIGYFEDATERLGLLAPPEWTPQTGIVDHCFGGIIADLTGDKYPEILMVCDFYESIMMFNARNGSFIKASDFMTGGNDMGSTVFDIDQDGRFDFFTTDVGGKFDETVPGCCLTAGHTGNRFYRNEGNGCFQEVQNKYGIQTGGWGWGAVHFDYENDGDLDLAMVNGPWAFYKPGLSINTNILWQNPGVGRWPWVDVSTQSSWNSAGVQNGRALVAFDFDNDGDLDLLTVYHDGDINHRGGYGLHEHVTNNNNYWLRVRLHGTISNSYGLGAEVSVYPHTGQGTRPFPRQLQLMDQNGYFMGNSEYILQETVVDVSVYWPASRRRVDYLSIKANQLIHLRESDGCDATNCTGTPCNLGICWAQIEAQTTLSCCSSLKICNGEPFESNCNAPDMMRMEVVIGKPSCPPPSSPLTAPVHSTTPSPPATQNQPAVYILATLLTIAILIILSFLVFHARRLHPGRLRCPDTLPTLAQIQRWLQPRFEKVDSGASMDSISGSATPEFSYTSDDEDRYTGSDFSNTD